MLVRSAMLPDPLTVRPETTLVEFIRAVLGSNQTTAAVVDGDRLLGVVSVHDIFLKILPPYVGHEIAEVIREGYFEEKFVKFTNIAVADVMVTDVSTLSPNEAVIKAVALFVRKSHKTIPVIENGRYIGSLTRRSVLRRVTESSA